MKKSRILFGAAILFFAGSIVMSFLIFFMQLFGKEMYAVYFLIFTGIIVARRGVREKNVEEGRNADYQEPISKAMVRRLNIIAIVFGVIALFLILKNVVF